MPLKDDTGNLEYRSAQPKKEAAVFKPAEKRTTKGRKAGLGA